MFTESPIEADPERYISTIDCTCICLGLSGEFSSIE